MSVNYNGITKKWEVWSGNVAAPRFIAAFETPQEVQEYLDSKRGGTYAEALNFEAYSRFDKEN